MLLATFTTEDDITRSRDRKVGAIDATIQITNVSIDALQKKLDGLKQRAAAQERSGQPLSSDITDNMNAIEQQITEKKNYVAYSQEQKEELKKQYAADMVRFRELKAAQQPQQQSQ